MLSLRIARSIFLFLGSAFAVMSVESCIRKFVRDWTLYNDVHEKEYADHAHLCYSRSGYIWT